MDYKAFTKHIKKAKNKINFPYNPPNNLFCEDDIFISHSIRK
jgi:hypothetical protein